MQPNILRGFRLATAYVFFLLGLSIAQSGGGQVVHVSNGESIQSAISSARSGTNILVGAGTYAEQLTIMTDGITLMGQGAILVPPTNATSNGCTDVAGPGSEAGICIHGDKIVLAEFVMDHQKVLSVGTRVKDVTVTGFDIRGFSGANIMVVGGEGTSVTGNYLFDGVQYGALSAGSLGTTVEGNSIEVEGDLKYIAICVDDNLGGQATVKRNTLSGYYIGLCTQTNHALLQANDISGCCLGAYIDPNITNAQVIDNHIGASDPRCATPEVGAFGIVAAAAMNSFISGNLIEGMTVGGANGSYAAGIAIWDDPIQNATTFASGNVVTGNVLKDNDVDLLIFTNGTGNVVTGNDCTTPEELCG